MSCWCIVLAPGGDELERRRGEESPISSLFLLIASSYSGIAPAPGGDELKRRRGEELTLLISSPSPRSESSRCVRSYCSSPPGHSTGDQACHQQRHRRARDRSRLGD